MCQKLLVYAMPGQFGKKIYARSFSGKNGTCQKCNRHIFFCQTKLRQALPENNSVRAVGMHCAKLSHFFSLANAELFLTVYAQMYLRSFSDWHIGG